MFEDFNYEIAGPWSYGPGPQPARRPIVARTPAGPVSLPWRERSYAGIRPQLAGLGAWGDWGDEVGNGNDEIPTFPVTTYAPYCQNLIPWVLGTALVVLLLTGGMRR